jgi:exopolyphosphatase/guanosine-5'-triphosphate,3'-diphosphate pyrophosphatase
VRKPLALGQGRLKERVPVAVVDIGSNSVRQVIYEGLTRAPAVLFNEKVLCGLGEGLVSTGKLNEVAVERALQTIRRFRALQFQAHVGEVHILATAAARDASNGPDFIRQVEALAGYPVEVLTGELEARYSALGIRSGFYKPAGIVGDLGGGSLELAGINEDIETGITLPLGGLRLRELAEGSLDKARKIARTHLRKNRIDWPGDTKTFFAVGGTWRSLGKLHIANRHYPLPAVHDYELDAAEMERFCTRIAQKDLEDFRGLAAVSKNRRELLPFGAVVLREIIHLYKPDRISISSLGVREGFLYSRLSERERAKDSLLVAARDLSILRARSPDHCVELAEWTTMAFREIGIEETENETRYRVAACYLADIGWRAHPDFRAQQALEVIANAGFVGIDHGGRAYLAISNYHRYQGLATKVQAPAIAALASPQLHQKARYLAGMFRVLYLFSASNPDVIPRIGLKKTGENTLQLSIPEDLSELIGERPLERISQLGSELKMEIEVVID